MKERPILFSSPMVRAILDGKKTQTRRIIKPQPTLTKPQGCGILSERPGWNLYGKKTFCPYGQRGDRLWVRESWQPIWAECDVPPEDGLRGPKGWAIKYPATDQVEEYYDEYRERVTSACKPSIHMPRWASRIDLEITNVRVERLQDISEEDAEAEGVHCGNEIICSDPHRHGFQQLWNSINGLDSWKENPFCWVIEFKRIE